MTASLAAIGTALYGPKWVRPLAEALGPRVNRRLVQRWNAGTEPIPDGVWCELYAMLRQRHLDNARLTTELRERLNPQGE